MSDRAFGIVTSTPRRVNCFGMQDYRPAGAFSFLGRYRVIDFAISNLSNSGIDNIQVYLNRNPRALTDHLGIGRTYNINSKSGRLQLLYCNHHKELNEVYNTDVSDYIDNMDYIDGLRQKYVVILPCYMVFRQDFSALLNEHIESGADITMLYHKVNNARDHYLNCRVMTLDQDQMVTSLELNRGNRMNQAVFMDTYIMTKELFLSLVHRAHEYSSTYSLAQMISVVCRGAELNIRGVQHKGYFASINDLKAYYDANIDLLDIKKARDLFQEDWPIYTRTTDSCPTKILEDAHVTGSMISNGCLIEGTVENCVIGRGVRIHKDAVVKNSIILSYAEIGSGITLDCQIVDKWARITRTKNDLISTPEEPGYVRKHDIL